MQKTSPRKKWNKKLMVKMKRKMTEKCWKMIGPTPTLKLWSLWCNATGRRASTLLPDLSLLWCFKQLKSMSTKTQLFCLKTWLTLCPQRRKSKLGIVKLFHFFTCICSHSLLAWLFGLLRTYFCPQPATMSEDWLHTSSTQTFSNRIYHAWFFVNFRGIVSWDFLYRENGNFWHL